MTDNENQASQRQEDPNMECHNRAERALGEVVGRGSEGKEMFENALKKALETECTCMGTRAKSLGEAVERGCLRCCGEHIEEANEYDNSEGKPSPLMEVARSGQVEIVWLLLYHQKDFTDNQGRTFESYIDEKSPREMLDMFPGSFGAMVRRVREAECCCDDASKNLIEAAESGCLRCCAEFIGQIGSRNVKDYRKTSLMKAAENGHLEIVKLLAHKEAGMQSKLGWTALMFAAKHGHAEVLEPLVALEAGMQDSNGFTALMEAAWKGRADFVQLLLPREAGMMQGQGKTATYFAALNMGSACISLLLADEREARLVPAQMLAAYRGDARAMLEARDKWKDAINNNATILHFAFAGCRHRCMRILLRDEEMRSFFETRSFDFEATTGDPQQAVEAMLPVLVRLASERLSINFANLAFNRNIASAGTLAPFSSSLPNRSLYSHITECERFDILAAFVKLAKNIGIIFYDKLILDLDMKCKDELTDLASNNPIYSKQIELARKQIAKNTTTDENGKQMFEEIPDSKQFSIRETQSEAAFNRIILLASRDISWKSISTQRRVEDPRASTLRSKQERNRLLIHSTIRFVKGELRKMMNE